MNTTQKKTTIAWHVELFVKKLISHHSSFGLFLLPLMGDKDHEKVYNINANFEKNYKREQHSDSSWRSNYYPAINSRRRLNPSNAPWCFYCNETGHFHAQCVKRQADTNLIQKKVQQEQQQKNTN